MIQWNSFHFSISNWSSNSKCSSRSEHYSILGTLPRGDARNTIAIYATIIPSDTDWTPPRTAGEEWNCRGAGDPPARKTRLQWKRRGIPTGNGFNEHESLKPRKPKKTIGFVGEIEIVTSEMRLGCHGRTALYSREERMLTVMRIDRPSFFLIVLSRRRTLLSWGWSRKNEQTGSKMVCENLNELELLSMTRVVSRRIWIC